MDTIVYATSWFYANVCPKIMMMYIYAEQWVYARLRRARPAAQIYLLRPDASSPFYCKSDMDASALTCDPTCPVFALLNPTALQLSAAKCPPMSLFLVPDDAAADPHDSFQVRLKTPRYDFQFTGNTLTRAFAVWFVNTFHPTDTTARRLAQKGKWMACQRDTSTRTYSLDDAVKLA